MNDVVSSLKQNLKSKQPIPKHRIQLLKQFDKEQWSKLLESLKDFGTSEFHNLIESVKGE